MTPHIVTSVGDEHAVSPATSSTPSFVSARSVLSDTAERSPGIQETFLAAESQAKSMDSLVIELSGSTKPQVSTTNPEGNASFIRHHKYFFPDGNITFLVEGTLYCIHRYFFSRDSGYFSARFSQFDIQDHEASHTTMSLADTARKDFDAFLSILYPENFGETELSYEEWKSVLHLSTRWGFNSIRRLALATMKPPTPHDRLLLARAYSVDHWVVPALAALCDRTAPLSLSEARQMDIEDVVLVVSVREVIRSRTLQVKTAETSHYVEAAQAGTLAGCGGFADLLSNPKKEPSVSATPSPVYQEQTATEEDAHERGNQHSKGGIGQISMQEGGRSHIAKDVRVGRQEGVAVIRAAATALPDAKASDARGARLDAVRGAEAATSRAEAARVKAGRPL